MLECRQALCADSMRKIVVGDHMRMTQQAEILDDAGGRAAIDKSNMSKAIASFPFQLEKGWELSKGIGPASFGFCPSSIVLSGMGGSAIGGDVLADAMRGLSGFRVDINRTYSLPRKLDKGVLHVGVSYSGNTEETISSFREGLERKVPSLGISSGGKIEEMCNLESIPFLKLPHGIQPRAALGYMLSALLGMVSRLGIYDFSGSIMESIQSARTAAASVAPDVPLEKNGAKQLAAWLGSSTPVIISTPAVFSAAERMKTQVNENAKRFAWLMTVPEANHNDWIPLRLDATIGRYKAIILEGVESNPLLKRRMAVVEEKLGENMGIRKVASLHGGILDELLRYIVIGDHMSYYLALLGSTDPTPVEPIEALKKEIDSRSV